MIRELLKNYQNLSHLLGERRSSIFMDCSSHFDWSLGIFRQLVIHTGKLRNYKY